MNQVIVSGSFDDIRSRQVRLLQEASRLGPVRVLLWSDAVVSRLAGKPPRFPLAERFYLVDAIRYVQQVTLVEDLPGPDALPPLPFDKPALWAFNEDEDSPARRAFCEAQGLAYQVIASLQLQGFPIKPPGAQQSSAGRRKALVTGCYDWLHSGHVRFFEEASQLGDLYVVVGHDENVRLLKGEGHPLFKQDERRYMVQAVRYVHEALISTGIGWMDAEPEIEQIKPDMYVVNEDGDKPEKRAFCAEHGLEYVVLKRAPKEGLPARESTKLRGY